METKMVTRWIPYLLGALPVAMGFLYVYLYGVNVVWRDEWDIVPLLHEISSGTFSVSELWENSQHNEHRFFFPYVVILLLATFTEWNTVAEMYLIQACLLITVIVLLLAFKASVGPRVLFFVPVAFLVFSLLQGFNMLWGYQLTFVFAETFGVLTFFFLYLSGRSNLTRFAFPAALASGMCAAFSAIQGLLVWPVGLLQLFAIPTEKSKKKLLLAGWSALGLGVWIVYFVDYAIKPEKPSSLLYSLTHPIEASGYFLSLLGSSLVDPRLQSLTFVSGLLLASLMAASFLLIYRSRMIGEFSFWIALLLFSLLVLVAITVGRFDLQQTITAPRYTNFSILALLSVYAMLTKLVLGARSRATIALFGILSVVVLLSLPASYQRGLKAGQASENQREQAAFVLYTYKSQPDKCLELVRKSNIRTVKRLAPRLEKLRYNVFSGSPIPPPERPIRCPE